MEKEKAVESSFLGDLDSTINYLIDAKNRGENIFIDFGTSNGVFRLYSSDIDFDNTYLRIYGLTRDEKKSYEEELNTSLDKEAVHSKYKNISEVYFDKQRDDSKEVEFKGDSLTDLVDELNEYKKLGKNVYIDFRSTEDDLPIRFYSMNINVNDAFMRVMGITKDQYDENKERFKLANSDEELQMVITDLYQLVEQNKKR